MTGTRILLFDAGCHALARLSVTPEQGNQSLAGDPWLTNRTITRLRAIPGQSFPGAGLVRRILRTSRPSGDNRHRWPVPAWGSVKA
jgi:hypothetical protein